VTSFVCSSMKKESKNFLRFYDSISVPWSAYEIRKIRLIAKLINSLSYKNGHLLLPFAQELVTCCMRYMK